MAASVTAQQIADRVRSQLSSPSPAMSGFAAGAPSTVVSGIATTFAPTLEVLHRAVESGRNLIVSRESPYWNSNPQRLADNPLFVAKQDFVAKHQLVIYRFSEAWQVDGADGSLRALARALGWDRYSATGIYYRLPPTTLQPLARLISSRLGVHSVRVIGDPATTVAKVALTHGLIRTPDLAKVLQEPDVDAVVIGEAVEWEASPYFQDVLAAGRKKGLIVTGLQASEEPGANEMAAWLKSFISEVPVESISAGEPFAAGRWS